MKTYRPTSPSLRHRIIVERDDLHNGKPIKHLTLGLRKKGGRNNHGHITARHRGGGAKRRYRLINFNRISDGIGTVLRIEYDPNRTARIALIKEETGKLYYILAPEELKSGQVIETRATNPYIIGNTLPIKDLPTGTLIHNIELIPGKGGQLVRAAGTYARILSKNLNGFASILLPSKEIRLVPLECLATVGKLSNPQHKLTAIGGAGYARYLGRRPRVRGVAMNPVDHPHGGGEGKTSGGRPSVTPWGRPTKGQPTRKKPRKYSLGKL